MLKWISNIFSKRTEGRSCDIQGLPTSGTLTDVDDFWYTAMGAGANEAGVMVNEFTAMKMIAVWVCVTLISGDIAKIPWVVYQHMPDGSRRRATEHPLYDILHNSPNSTMTAFNYKESALPHCLLHGNHFSLIERNKYTGKILGLWPIEVPHGISSEYETVPFNVVDVKRNGREVTYHWMDTKGRSNIGTQNDIFHVPGFGFNGIKGLSCIRYAASTVATGIASNKFIQRFFGRGTHPSVVVTFPEEGSGMTQDEADKYAVALQRRIGGLGKTHDVVALHNGEKIDRFTMPLADAQFLENKKMTTSDVCSFFHVPPDRAGIYGKNANHNQSEADNQRYVDNCLTHWTTRFEQVANLRLLTKEDRAQGYYTEFLLSSLVKGNIKDRFDSYKTMLDKGVPLNRILAAENMNPVDGGDMGMVPLNSIPISLVEEFFKARIKKLNETKTPEPAQQKGQQQ